MPLSAIEAQGVGALGAVRPIDQLLTGLPGVVLTPVGVRRAEHGNELEPAHFVLRPAGVQVPPSAHVRLLDEGGRLLAIAERPDAREVLHPVVVLK
jgi:hypothetical protein